jgi:hypothetical protein
MPNLVQLTEKSKMPRPRITCLICEQIVYCSKLSWHLLGHGISVRDYYHTYVAKTQEVPTCKECGVVLEFYLYSKPYRTYCSKSCKGKSVFREHGYVFTSQEISERNVRKWKDKAYRDNLVQKAKDRWTNPDYRSKITGNGYGSGYHDSPIAGRIHYRSSWEKRAYEILDCNEWLMTYAVEAIHIPYQIDGITHNYIPDIVATWIDGSVHLIEISRNNDLENKKHKIEAATAYAKANNCLFYIWTQDHLWNESDA